MPRPAAGTRGQRCSPHHHEDNPNEKIWFKTFPAAAAREARCAGVHARKGQHTGVARQQIATLRPDLNPCRFTTRNMNDQLKALALAPLGAFQPAWFAAADISAAGHHQTGLCSMVTTHRHDAPPHGQGPRRRPNRRPGGSRDRTTGHCRAGGFARCFPCARRVIERQIDGAPCRHRAKENAAG